MFDTTDVSKLGESHRDRWRRDHIGLVFQNFHLIEELSRATTSGAAGSTGCRQ